ncbi:MAG TPA: hypothetical protein ENO20_01010 [Bacteroides sp.]|nr:hypothetical protein [Bacteroides sp.]
MKRCLLITGFLGVISLIGAQTIIPAGEVYGKWDMIGSPYQITGDIHIPHDSTLIIDPGVVVEFQGYFHLKVSGRLLAMGSVADTILFTVNDTTGFADPDTSLGGWNGIRICDISAENDSTKLSYCKFQYGKAVGDGWFLNAGGALCVIDFDKVTVSNCTFAHNSAGGPAAESPAGGAIHLAWSDIRLVDNTFLFNRAYEGGAIQMHDSDPVFINNFISNNRCIQSGGGISCGGASNPSFSGDRIINNSAGSHGGGIILWGPGEASFSNVTVTGNSAHWGGGIGFSGYEARIINSEISDNHAIWLGGGIAADESELTIRNSLFEGDTALSQSGAIHTWQGKLHIRDCGFNDNYSETGGAVHTDFSTLDIERSSFVRNTAHVGGALQVFDGHLEIDSCLFDSNEAAVNGGALEYIADSLVFDSLYVVRIRDAHFIKNRAGTAAGGFTIQQSHTDEALIDVHVDRCRIIENQARQVAGFRIMRCIQEIRFSNSMVSGNRAEAWTGGGTFNAGSVGSISNCVFYDNQAATVSAGASSGGFGVGNGSVAHVYNCTFVKNSSGSGGGLYVHRGSEGIVINTIFRGNIPDQIALAASTDTTPCMLTLHYNDIQYSEDSIQVTDSISTLFYGTGNVDLDPLFVDEASGVLHLQDDSPLIGAGTASMEIEGNGYVCPPVDMEGNPRPDPAGSSPDMGAYENQHAWPVGLNELISTANGELCLKVYPNPFSQAITLEFVLPERSRVDIRVFNLLGTEVATPVTSMMEPEVQHISWNPENRRGGIHVVQIRVQTAGGEVYRETCGIIRAL